MGFKCTCYHSYTSSKYFFSLEWYFRHIAEFTMHGMKGKTPHSTARSIENVQSLRSSSILLIGISFLALLNRFAILRDYTTCITNYSIDHLRSRNCKLFVQTLSPLKFTDRLASNFMRGILGWVSTKVREIMIFDVLL